MASGDQISQVFNVAAIYHYQCIFHSPTMAGVVQVNMKVQPRSGGVDTQFTIIWARMSIPDGFNADIQIKRPGAPTFVDWVTDQTGLQTSTQFTPDAGTGIYQFHSRLQNDAGGSSSYSRPFRIIVS